jgi:hypothetical protein
MPLIPALPDRALRALSRVVAVLTVLVLLLDVFVVAGARRLGVVDPAEALVSYGDDDTFDGLEGWDRPLTGVRPEPGVYVYATEGFTRLDRMGIERRYPAFSTRIVTHGPGCQWRETVPIFEEHRETYSACARDGDQLDTGFGTRLVYFFVPATTDAVCEPGGTRTGARMQPGQTREFSCRDDAHDVDVTGSVTYEGAGSVDVAGAPVACRKVRILTVLTGSNEGGAVRSLCTTPETGLVLSETRSVGIVVRSGFIGTVTYAEEATFTLTSLVPLV